MRNVVLAVAISLDGYIARPDGSLDWLLTDPGHDQQKFLASFEIALMGRKSYDVAVRLGGADLFKSSKIEYYVFSRSKPPGKRDGVEFVRRSPGTMVEELKLRAGKDIWLMGGGELAREFLDQDLVDRIDLGIMPVLLGAGIPLFPGGFPQRQFELVKHISYPTGLLEVSYARGSAV
jgi:dihydrofolate reductase